jgi:hypothetical protein
MLVYIPKSVVDHYNSTQLFRDTVKNKFKTEKKELEYGDSGIVYDRISNVEYKIVGWSKINFEVYIITSGIQRGVNPAWLVK